MSFRASRQVLAPRLCDPGLRDLDHAYSRSERRHRDLRVAWYAEAAVRVLA
jgi:hypothetical protein